MGLGKWITSGLGFAFGGPIGALIGYFIGSTLESAGSKTTVRSGRSTSNDFLISLLVLISSVMKADKKVLRSELDVVKSFLLNTYGESKAKDALLILKDLLQKNFDVVPVAEQIAGNIPYSGRLEMLHLLFSIAGADNELSESEVRLIHQIALSMGVNEADYKSIYSIFNKQKNADWAYSVLEIEKTATNDEVKKAYRRMAMKYHPDKVNNMGEEVKKTATEKFRAVNEAYNAIKTERGID